MSFIPDPIARWIGRFNVENMSTEGTSGSVPTSDGSGDLSMDTELDTPSGLIVLWSGSLTDIPSGWSLCDGEDGTPDLRDRFVVGAGDGYAVDATGGEEQVSLSSSEMPSHSHGDGSLSTDSHSHGSGSYSTGTDGDHSHSYHNRSINTFEAASGSNEHVPGGLQDATTESAGSHSHSVSGSSSSSSAGVSGSTSSRGGSGSHENRPPYYALAYIMKL